MQGVNPLLTHATKQFALGTKAFDSKDPSRKLMYVQADDALTAGNACTFDFAVGGSGLAANKPYVVTHTSAVAQEVVGIPLVNFTAGYYGWIVIEGKVSDVNVASSVAAGDILVSTATAGRLNKHVSTATNPSDADHNALTQACGGAIPVAVTAESSNKSDVLLR